MTDNDGFATFAHHVTVAVAFWVSLLLWGMQKRWRPLVLFVALKAVVLAWWLPAPGLATLTMSYAQLAGAPGALHYFWLVPPAMLAITMIEGWWSCVIAAGRGLRDTGPWKHRRRLATLTAFVALVGLTWWFAAPEYYLWKLRRDGHGPQSGALRDMGARVLPRLYEELASLGREPAGEVRSTLVAIIADIRHDIIAEQVGDGGFDVVATSPADIDEEMLERLVRALENEPLTEERQRMTMWLGRLDYSMGIATFCEAAPRMPKEAWRHLMIMISGYVGFATRDHYEPGQSPWRDASAAQVAERKADLMRHLQACVPQRLVEVLVAHVGESHTEEISWMNSAIEMLAALAPLRDDQVLALEASYAKLEDSWLASSMLDKFAAAMAGPGQSLDDLMRELYPSAQTPAARKGILQWLQAHEHHSTSVALFCQHFTTTPDGERGALLLTLPAESPDPCISGALMQGLDELLYARQQDPPDWFGHALHWLRKQADAQHDIRAWAKAAIKRRHEAPLADYLSSLALGDSDGA